MISELQSTLADSAIDPPALSNHLPCMVHAIQLALSAFMSSLGVKGRTKSWEAHEHNQQFGENQSIDIGKSQRLWKEGNARINNMSAMRQGLAKINVKVHISRYFESPETDHHSAENACSIDYADTWSLKRVHWLSKSQCLHRGTTYYGSEDTSELNTGVSWASLPITRIHPWVAPKAKTPWLPATLHNAWWMDHCQVRHAPFEAIPISDHVDVEEAYGHIASRDHILQWNVWLSGWCHASFRSDEDSIEGRLVPCREVSTTEAVQILCWSSSNHGYASHFCTYPRSFLEVAIL